MGKANVHAALCRCTRLEVVQGLTFRLLTLHLGSRGILAIRRIPISEAALISARFRRNHSKYPPPLLFGGAELCEVPRF